MSPLPLYTTFPDSAAVTGWPALPDTTIPLRLSSPALKLFMILPLVGQRHFSEVLYFSVEGILDLTGLLEDIFGVEDGGFFALTTLVGFAVFAAELVFLAGGISLKT